MTKAGGEKVGSEPSPPASPTVRRGRALPRAVRVRRRLTARETGAGGGRGLTRVDRPGDRTLRPRPPSVRLLSRLAERPAQ